VSWASDVEIYQAVDTNYLAGLVWDGSAIRLA